MVKKFSLLLATAAALCLAMSAAASASKVTSSAGVLTPVGTVITATGSDITFTSTTLGATTCKTLTVKFTLTKNNGTTAEGAGESEAPAQEFCVNGTKPVIVTTFTVANVTMTTTGTGTMSFIATEDIGELHCTFTGTKVPFTYVAGSDTITFTNAGGITSVPVICGTAKLDGSFTLEIKTAPVILD
jgi:hypothetical protein